MTMSSGATQVRDDGKSAQARDDAAPAPRALRREVME
jgi:hypothetical protein